MKKVWDILDQLVGTVRNIIGHKTLNRRQKRVYEWLNEKLDLPVFAEAYKGAAILVIQRSAGHVSFVAHAGRDLMNGLAPTANGITRPQVQYVKLVNDIQDDWKDEWGSGTKLSQDVVEESHAIPHRVCRKISTLVAEHQSGRKRTLEAEGQFFSTFLDYSDKNKIPKNLISEWRAAKLWFSKNNHLRKKPFRAEINDELVKHFKCLDDYLYIAASSQYERLKALDEILESTNE